MVESKSREKKVKTNDNTKLIPKSSKSEHSIPLKFPGIKVAQCEYREGPVGLTFIKCDKGMKVHMEVRGGWPGYINCLSTNNKQTINGINISGGSLLGLESTTGIIAESLRSKKYKNWDGYNGAIIWSSNLIHNKIYPDKDLGRFGLNQNDKKLYMGQVGAGLSSNHGQGWGYKELGKLKILALCVNNAIGNVYEGNKIIHKPNNVADVKKVDLIKNTTIIVIITNLKLDNDELRQMNQQVNVSIGETIRPFNTFADGDILYTCSTEQVDRNLKYWERIKFFDECSEVLKEAILNSIK